MGMENGAAYMTVLNRSGAEDRLRSAKASIAGVVELHETVLDGEMMKMEPHPEGFALPAGGELELKPGGKHVMLIGLNEPLAEGRTFELTLVFERAGPMTVTVPVRTP
jgi:copper(I)-binding protein